jgi:hypothetical protein
MEIAPCGGAKKKRGQKIEAINPNDQNKPHANQRLPCLKAYPHVESLHRVD